MPRFANLKGSMNPFDNNKPVLSSSERLKNKRDKTIYQSQKQHFQSKRKCGNKNVKYYDNGTIRSTNSYKMNMKLSRGAALCQDCEGNGTLCENIFDKNDLTKITMGNNVLSTLNLESGLVGTGGLVGTSVSKNHIIITDIIGVWGGSATDISKSLIGPNGTLPFPSTIPTPYGYTNNLINVPRNLDGNGIIIDPSNVIFPMDDNCNSRTIPKPNYMNLASIKTFIIYEGPLSAGITGNQITNASQAVSSNPSSPNYFTQYIGYFCTFTFGSAQLSLTEAAPTGQIIKICPLGETLMNDTLFGPPPAGSIFKVDTFRVYIEITYFGTTPLWQGNIYPSIDKNNFMPQFKPNSISSFVVIGYTPATSGFPLPAFSIYSDWASNYSTAFGPSNQGGGIEMSVTIDQNNVDTCGISQLRGNNTKQNYMSCLEDKTRKINFTTNDNNTF